MMPLPLRPSNQKSEFSLAKPASDARKIALDQPTQSGLAAIAASVEF
jgi:hypothetical protein